MNAHVDQKSFTAAATAATAVSLFDFKGHRIRVVMIDGTPWFVARDVCVALDMDMRSGTAKWTRSLDPAQKLTKTFGEIDPRLLCGSKGRGGVNASTQVSLISESAVYKLTLRSNKPEAKPFQDWVTKEVLPAIRKDGAYIMGEEKVRTGEMSEDELVLKALEVMQTKIARLTVFIAARAEVRHSVHTVPHLGRSPRRTRHNSRLLSQQTPPR